jgi:hypothetical protein
MTVSDVVDRGIIEQQAVFESGPLLLAGTLALPRNGGALSRVLLLVGPGPVDRNKTGGACE